MDALIRLIQHYWSHELSIVLVLLQSIPRSQPINMITQACSMLHSSIMFVLLQIIGGGYEVIRLATFAHLLQLSEEAARLGMV